jgi:hypothetical protein
LNRIINVNNTKRKVQVLSKEVGFIFMAHRNYLHKSIDM